MRRLKEKFKSNEGASLILALLVFLLCIMVAFSVLAAAVSNAGRARSVRVEQQRYQTLSSAVRLICGELEKVEYTGKYEVSEWNTGGVNYFYCRQQNGEFKMQSAYSGQTLRLADFSFLTDGLKKEMDEVFRRRFRKEDGSGDAKEGYAPLADAEVAAASAACLTVTLPDNLAGYPYAAGSTPGRYEIPKTVNVRIELDHDTRNLRVTAWLDDAGNPPSAGSGVMAAELAADADPAPTVPAPPTAPGSEADIPAGNTPAPNTVSVKWKLDRTSMTTAP